MDQQFDQVFSIGRIIFGARGRERFTIFGESVRVDGIEDEEVVLQESKDERATRLFQADSNLFTGKASAQRDGPPSRELQACD